MRSKFTVNNVMDIYAPIERFRLVSRIRTDEDYTVEGDFVLDTDAKDHARAHLQDGIIFRLYDEHGVCVWAAHQAKKELLSGRR